MGSRRVPTEFRRPRTCPWHESEFCGAEPLPRHGDGLKRDRMGTESEPRSLRIEPIGGWAGARTLHDRADNRRRTGDPPLGRERAPMATAISPPAAGWEPKRRSAGRPASRSVTRARRAIRTAPNSGTSRRGALGANGRPEERSDGERDGTEDARNDRGVREGARGRMTEGELGRRPEDAVRAARREVSTGTNS